MARSILAALDAIRLERSHIRFRDNMALHEWLSGLDGAAFDTIGTSRAGQDLFGVRVGHGPRRASILAGCHADEPIGPLTAQLLPIILHRNFPQLLEHWSLFIVPQMNPDGADVNRVWFSDPPDIVQYVRHAVREQPGDDIEFGFGAPGARPENDAARSFLEPHAPFAAHFSLHGMAFSHGAWFLLCREWAERACVLMDGLEAYCKRMLFPLHDVDRKGAKGFTRLRPGFSTTPRADAMQAHFRALGDEAMASRFHPSSMEMVRGWGGDTLCMVSELPLFGIGKRSGSIEHPASHDLAAEFQQIAHLDGEEFAQAVNNIAFAYELGPVSVQFQVRAQIAMIALALDFLDR